MSEIDTTTDDTRTTADAPERDNAIEAPALPGVAVPEASQVGDENVADVREVDVTVNTESVPAQVTGQPANVVDEVRVHETFVTTDTVITDTSDPRAVQIPDAGRGTLDLPIHALGNGTVEDYFAKHAAEADES